LAHIRRHDYLVNLLQTAVEILGFYHPAVWWLSRRIRIEREHCCDDLAVSVCQDRLFYARALTTMAEIRAAHSAFALTITGPSLFDRIRRLLGQDSSSERKSSWLPSVVAMVLIAALVMPICFALASQTDTDIGKCEPKTITLTIFPDNEAAEKEDIVKLSLFDFSNEKTVDVTMNFVSVH
jgi:beta-lactamase regulating signal transducer with metallopeptidase domain